MLHGLHCTSLVPARGLDKDVRNKCFFPLIFQVSVWFKMWRSASSLSKGHSIKSILSASFLSFFLDITPSVVFISVYTSWFCYKSMYSTGCYYKPSNQRRMVSWGPSLNPLRVFPLFLRRVLFRLSMVQSHVNTFPNMLSCYFSFVYHNHLRVLFIWSVEFFRFFSAFQQRCCWKWLS